MAAALDKPTYMAASLDLAGAARLLIDSGLAIVGEKIVLGRRISRFAFVADFTTLKGIARLLLVTRPPDWLRQAVIDGQVKVELIPRIDFESLEWLGSDFETIITAAYAEVYGPIDQSLLKRLGDAGELAVMSALQLKGHAPRHVALISDRYGYDIELGLGTNLLAIEVKTAVRSSADRMFLSRNEFDVSQRMGETWKVVQVIFSTKVIALGRALAEDILEIRELTSASLIGMVPVEGPAFRWLESAEFRPSAEDWRVSGLRVDDGFQADLTEPAASM